MNDIKRKMEVSEEMRAKVETAIMDCILTVQKRYGKDRVNIMPKVKYDTLSTSAGLARYKHSSNECWIIINPILLNENEVEMIENTIPHEIAHLVVFYLFRNNTFRKIYPHGDEWRSIMYLFGVKPEVYHNYDITTLNIVRGKKEYEYKCNCKVHKVSERVHKNIQLKNKGYYCKLCKSKIELIKKGIDIVDKVLV